MESEERIHPREVRGQAQDPSGASVPRFSSLVAGPALQEAVEKPPSGEPFVRLGKLFLVVGAWMFQQGGLLGCLLRGQPVLLGKMLGVPAGNAAEYVTGLRARAAEMLALVAGEEKTFFRLFVVRELLGVGVDITAWLRANAWRTSKTLSLYHSSHKFHSSKAWVLVIISQRFFVSTGSTAISALREGIARNACRRVGTP